MCGGGGPPTVQQAPAQIQPKNPDVAQASQLPAPKQKVEEDEITTGVEYGKKSDPLVAAKATGTDALKINLNTGAGGTGSGGINV